MKKRNNTIPEGTVNSYIQPSRNVAGHPAQVAQDGWIAYFNLPSARHSRPSYEEGGRGFFKGKYSA